MITFFGNGITLNLVAIGNKGISGYLVSNQTVGDYVIQAKVKSKGSANEAYYETRLQV